MRIENQESLIAVSVATFAIFPAFAFGDGDRFPENAAKLIVFVEKLLNAFRREQISDYDEAAYGA